MQSMKRHLAAAGALALSLAVVTATASGGPPSSPPGAAGNSGQEKAEQAQQDHQQATPAGQGSAGKSSDNPGKQKASQARSNGKSQGAGSSGKSGAKASVAPSNDGVRSTDAESRHIVICHHTPAQWVIISIDRAAWPAHQAHGDKYLRDGHPGLSSDAAAVRAMLGPDRNGLCGQAAVSAPPTTTTTETTPAVTTATAPTVTTETTAAALAAPTPPAAGAVDVGGVEGVTETQEEPGGVLGAFTTLGKAAGGALPFTGFPVWAALLLAVALIVLGYALWRRSRPVARDLV